MRGQAISKMGGRSHDDEERERLRVDTVKRRDDLERLQVDTATASDDETLSVYKSIPPTRNRNTFESTGVRIGITRLAGWPRRRRDERLRVDTVKRRDDASTSLESISSRFRGDAILSSNMPNFENSKVAARRLSDAQSGGGPA